MSKEIYKRVVRCIEDACEREVAHIMPSSRLREDLQTGCLQVILFQVRLEEEFLFSFDPMEEMAKIFYSVESVCRYLENR